MAGDGGHPEAAERLKAYWAEGAGAAKIRWGEGGDFDRCVAEVGKYMPDKEARGYCANLHKRATGAWPGRAAGESKAGHAEILGSQITHGS